MRSDAQSRKLPPRWRGAGPVVVVTLALLALGGAWLFPWAAGAYYLERGGYNLDASGSAGPRLDVAEDQLQRALAWDPNNAQAYYLLASLYRRRGDWPRAAEALVHYVNLQPKNPNGYWQLSLACEQLDASTLDQVPDVACGRNESGREDALARLWSLAGYSASDFVAAGDQSFRAERWDEAEAHYRRALIVDPDEPAARLGLAELSQARGDVEAAMEAYARLVAESTTPKAVAEAHARRGQILAAQKKWDQARSELSQAVALMPQEGKYRLDYGWYLYRANGPIAEARQELTIAATLLPQDPTPFFRLANASFGQGNYQQALLDAEKAIETNAANAQGWIWKGRALDQLGRLAEAESAFRQALQLAPKNAAVHAGLGDVLGQAGRMDEAIEEYEQAVALAPDQVPYRLSLAQAYRLNGQVDEAIAAYRQVLELNPENRTAKQALQTLEGGE
ncbi:MAG: tetratricopeptide repeat protein [Anaerolineae bacterium]